MGYSVNFTIQAEKDLARLDKTIAQNIANKIDWLSQNIENINPTSLKGKFKDKWIASVFPAVYRRVKRANMIKNNSLH